MAAPITLTSKIDHLCHNQSCKIEHADEST